MIKGKFTGELMGGEKEMNMIYRFLAENNNGLQLVVDYYEKQDAINKKNQFEKYSKNQTFVCKFSTCSVNNTIPRPNS